MPAPVASGWAKLGDALGGDSELEYEKGLNLGANTENALAQASERRNKAQAQQQLAGQLRAAGFSDADSDASAGALTAGANLGDVLSMKGKQQEYDFRTKAGDPNLPFSERNTALQGVAAAPVERFGTVGENMFQDKFSDTDTPTTSEYGKANIKAKEATASRANNGGRPKIYMVGNVPYLQGADGSLERQLTPEEVANNFGITEQGKGQGRNAAKADAALPAAFAKYRNTTDNANQVMSKIDDALKDVSWVSAGPLAGGSNNVPGTPAFKLAQAVLSIKANVGFQELSKMRHESPTGGALGNVTEKELEFLQGAIASLNTAQDPKDLAKALADVRDSYARYKDYAAQDYEIAQERAKYKPVEAPGQEPAAAQPGPGNQSAPNAPNNGGPVTIHDDAGYDALPPGAEFIGPDGQKRRKP
jgi:hypothetical protein